MGYGRILPKGHLPVYSVNTEKEAEELLAMSCELVFVKGEGRTAYIAAELEKEQTLENLYAFGRRLDGNYKKMMESKQDV